MATHIPKELLEHLNSLTSNQLKLVESVIDKLVQQAEYWKIDDSDAVSPQFLHSFGDILKIHHCFSNEPFTKDKFEHAIERIYRSEGREANLTTRGYPGHDLTVDGERWSLKTQANKNIKTDLLHISKFMELGRGEWNHEADLPGLRDQFLEHMASYERIFCLRRLPSGIPHSFHYELVEIPKQLLAQALNGDFAMHHTSRQNPKPGTCSVYSASKSLLFQLYFDGGSERKLQIRSLSKQSCKVHATWEIQDD